MKIVAEKSRWHRFAFYFDYTPDRVEFCRILKDSFGWERFSFNADDGQKRWVFSETVFIRLVAEKFPEVEIEPQVMEIWNHEEGRDLVEKKREETVTNVKDKADTDFKVNGIKGELYPYQKVGVEFLVASGGRAMITDSMGLGKTLQALGYITHTKAERTLVICPATVKPSWANEIKKWTKLSYAIIDPKTKVEEIPSNTNVWIINYDVLKKFLPTLRKIRFDVLVADEAHMLKNHRAIRTKVVKTLSTHIPKIIFLTGTPLLSRPVEMFTLLNMIDPQTWNNWYSFTRKFCGGHQGRWGYDASGATNTDELHDHIKKYFIRRKKDEVLTQLPPKNRIDYPVTLDPEKQKEYNDAENNLIYYLRQYQGKQAKDLQRIIQAERLAQLNILRQLCALGKIDSAKTIIDDAIESDEKILVFSSFVAPLDALKEYYGDSAVMITGQTPVDERGQIVDKFQGDPEKKVFLGGIRSAGTGITLTAASNVLFLDFDFVPAMMQQAEDRVHRPGQTASSVNIYQLYAEGTIDEKLRKILERKQKVFDRIIEGEAYDERGKDESIKEVIKDLLERYDEGK